MYSAIENKWDWSQLTLEQKAWLEKVTKERRLQIKIKAADKNKKARPVW